MWARALALTCPTACWAQGEPVGQGDGLHDHFQVVIAVRPAAQHVQGEVQLGGGLNGDLIHDGTSFLQPDLPGFQIEPLVLGLAHGEGLAGQHPVEDHRGEERLFRHGGQ